MDGYIITMLALLTVTVLLLVIDIIRIDLVAILVMLFLGWSGILTMGDVFSGFSSNAVIAMMGVMIISQGLARTGIVMKLSRLLLKRVGDGKRIMVLTISLMAGLLSGIMITVGVAALFLPVLMLVSRQRKIPASDLLIPIGFSAILGANLTMVGSAPLIVLNDLLRSGGRDAYGLLDVSPVGMLLLVAGLLYFWFLGDRVLPDKSKEVDTTYQEKLMDHLHLNRTIHHYRIPPRCPMNGQTIQEADLWRRFRLHVLALGKEENVQYIPWRGTTFEPGQNIALLGEISNARQFARECGLEETKGPLFFDALEDQDSGGFAEVIIPPDSDLNGVTLREYGLRKKYAVEPMILFSKGEEVRDDFSDHPITQGDTLVVYGLWRDMDQLNKSGNFIVVTPYTSTTQHPAKTPMAVAGLAGAVMLTLFGYPVSLAFFTGGMVMVLTGVITIHDAYKSIDWKVIFLLAGLIPLGTAMQKTGTAEWLANSLMMFIQGKHPLVLLFTVALISSFFSLFMSNVGTVVVLTPLVMSMAKTAGMDPRSVALLAAVCASNALLLPTHQVSALILTPGGYRNRDFTKAGGGITLLYVVVSVFYFYWVVL